MRRTLAILAVVALILLAGCSGIFGDSDEPGPATPTTPAENNSTPTQTYEPKPSIFTNVTSTTAPEWTAPETLNESIIEHHEARLREAGSFAIQRRARTTMDERPSYNESFAFRINLDENRAYESHLQKQDGIETVSNLRYTTDSKTYVLNTTGEEPLYRFNRSADNYGPALTGTPPYDQAVRPVLTKFVFGYGLIERPSETHTYTKNGTTERFGETLTVYDFSLSDSKLDEMSTGEWEYLVVDGEMLVDEDGIIRSASLHVVMDQTRTEESYKFELWGTYEVVQVGDVSVEQPEWVESASE